MRRRGSTDQRRYIPAARGEHQLTFRLDPERDRCIPARRGNLEDLRDHPTITPVHPARAGNTTQRSGDDSRMNGTSPRARGEHASRIVVGFSTIGTSPRPRGTHADEPESYPHTPVHPRARGGTHYGSMR